MPRPCHHENPAAVDALLSPRRRRVLSVMGATSAAIGAAALLPACGWRADSAAPRWRFGGHIMGTTWSMRLAGPGIDERLAAEAQGAVAAALAGVVARMSTYDAASEIGRFNRHADNRPMAMSADTLAVLERAQQVARLSGGAFDATVAPLVGAWGFGAGASARRAALPAAPGAAELAALAGAVGWQKLRLDAARGTVGKAEPALQLDLSGIAKGHAVDLAAQALERLGLAHYMVEAGGEIRCRGRNDQGRPWQIAIEKPDAWPQQVQRVLALADAAMATSGDYRSFYELDGQRIHHEIDPATRAPARHALASVTVLHPECMAADAWATALFVRGPDEGLALAQAQGLAALFIVRGADGGLRERATPAFQALG